MTGRYVRIWLALAQYGLLRELAFRGNFLIKLFVEVLWLTILLVFYATVFSQTSVVASWTQAQYLFFIGCYFALGGVLETFFIENCNDFANLVRTGDLDFYLLKPIDEQFLITCKRVDWSTAPNVLMGSGVMIFGLIKMNWQFDAVQLVLFLALFACGVALAYGFLVLLSALSIWFVRNQSLYEVWWLFSTLMRYPRDIFRHWASPIAWFFTFLVPIMLVVNVPARTLAKAFEPLFALYTVGATIVVLVVSRQFFRYALRRYRSASS